MEWKKLPQNNIDEFLLFVFKKQTIIDEILNSPDNKCIFHASRGKNSCCDNEQETPYGFCVRHAGSVQAKTAKDKLLQLTQSVEKVQDTPDLAQLEKEKLEKTKAQKEKLAQAQKLEKEKLEKEKLEGVQKGKIQKEKLEKEKLERVKKEKLELEKIQKEKQEKKAQRLEKEQKLEQLLASQSQKIDQLLLKQETDQLLKKQEKNEEEKSEEESDESEDESDREESGEENIYRDSGREIPRKKTAKIKKNKWDNYEHEDNGIVFDIKTKNAFGIQHSNGDVYSLGPEQIKICLLNGWEYVLPEAKYVYEHSDNEGSDVSSDDSSDE